jgi:hypothetical protein
MFGNPIGGVLQCSPLAQGTWEDGHRQVWDNNRLGGSQEVHPQMRLLTQPGIAVPHAAGNERIVVAWNDKHRAGIVRAFQDGECPVGIGA